MCQSAEGHNSHRPPTTKRCVAPLLGLALCACNAEEQSITIDLRSLDGMTIDIGAHRVGETVPQAIRFVLHGSQALELHAVEASCACVDIHLLVGDQRRPLPLPEPLVLDSSLAVTVVAYVQIASPGWNEALLRFLVADNGIKIIQQLKLVSFGEEAVVSEPRSVYLGEVSVGASVPFRFSVTPGVVQEISRLTVIQATRGLTIDSVRRDTMSNWSVEGKLCPESSGSFIGQVRWQANDSVAGSTSVVAVCIDDVEVLPARYLNLGRIDRDEQEVTIVFRSRTTLKLLDVARVACVVTSGHAVARVHEQSIVLKVAGLPNEVIRGNLSAIVQGRRHVLPFIGRRAAHTASSKR